MGRITETRLFRGLGPEKVALPGSSERRLRRRYSGFMADGLSALYQDLLTGSYDCVDRIVLNGYFRPGHNAGGFRIWWHNLTGGVETLDDTHLMRLGRSFQPASPWLGQGQRGSRD